MSAPAFAFRTAESVPGVKRLMEIVEVLDALRIEHQRIAGQVLSDLEFMDVPTIDTRHLEDEKGVRIGMVFHVNAFESETTGNVRIIAHRAARCSSRNRHVDDCAAPVGVRIKRKYTRVGRRCWNTFLGDHVLVGTPGGDIEHFTLAPLSSTSVRSADGQVSDGQRVR